MSDPAKKQMSERDICTKFITPALVKAGWDVQTQIREEVSLTKGRVIVSGRVYHRGEAKRADFVLSFKPNLPLAIIEAKDNNHTVSDGMQQALGYADILKDVPFVFSSNGDGFLFHDRTIKSGVVERQLSLEEFPSPAELWQRYCASRELPSDIQTVVTQDYYPSPENKTPRYYQLTAINRTIEAIAKGQNRVLLVMATGTGKTFVAFQIIWRLWKSKAKKRILFLADRNILVDQARTNDFKPFGAGCQNDPHNDECRRPRFDSAIETSYLRERFHFLNDMAKAAEIEDVLLTKYILDIDLDYFHTAKANSPDDPSLFYEMIQRAAAISIATEPRYVISTRLEGETIDAEYLLARLKEHIKNAMK